MMSWAPCMMSGVGVSSVPQGGYSVFQAMPGISGGMDQEEAWSLCGTAIGLGGNPRPVRDPCAGRVLPLQMCAWRARPWAPPASSK